MPRDTQHRVLGAIDSLISHLVPRDPLEDEETAQDRHIACLELAKTVISSNANPAISSDVNHASDLIKRKLIQSNPQQALKFSNLYTRLLALPVLGQKWAILYLLYQLADSPDPNEPLPIEHLREPSPEHAPSEGSSSLAQAAARLDPEEHVERLIHPPHLRNNRQSPEPDTPSESEPAGWPSREGTSRKGMDGADEDAGITARAASPKRQKKDDRDVSLKSALLAANSVDYDPSEKSLLRDMAFTLQGLSSSTLPFTRGGGVKLPPTLPAPIISLLHTLAEPSLLYRGLADFVKTPAGGLLGQSLRAAINGELRSYLTLIATLEGQVRSALSCLDETAPRGGIGKAGVTLKRCVVWTREATMGLRLLSLIAEESKSKRGGQLISLIHGFSSSHGDPIVAAFAERLLAHVTRPFYDILRHWIYDGELSDPYKEFFVREQDPNGENRKARKDQGESSVWNDKYEIDEKMIPSIITADFSHKVFLIGKSLNFTRHSCGDSEWVETYSKAASKELRYGDTETLEAWIDEAYKTTMRRLMDLMTTKFNLFKHLRALKSYILLGQGDFIALLMESLAANLDRPAGAQFRHTLTAQLEHAIRNSNAQYDDLEVLRRLDARMLQLSHGDIGWDCFTLEYKIDAPVDVVVTEWGNRQYLKVFNFLWRIKRVEFALSSTWRKCMTGARGVLQTDDAQVRQTWKSTRGVLAEMVHFVGQLQYYILFEVIESSWEQLQAGIRRDDATLDDLIREHTRYLTAITHKGLLGARRSTRQPGGGAAVPGTSDDRSGYMVQLGELLHGMLAYRDSVDGLYSWSVSDFTRRQESDILQRQDGGGGGGGGGAAGLHSGVESEFPALQERLSGLGGDFRKRVAMLLGDLAYQPDVDMRFLGVAMNFNDIYQPTRRKSKPSASQIASSMLGSTSKG